MKAKIHLPIVGFVIFVVVAVVLTTLVYGSLREPRSHTAKPGITAGYRFLSATTPPPSTSATNNSPAHAAPASHQTAATAMIAGEARNSTMPGCSLTTASALLARTRSISSPAIHQRMPA